MENNKIEHKKEELPTELTSQTPEEIDVILKDVPEEYRERIQCAIVHQSQRSVFQGPLPPPEIFAKYDSILPGAAERILAMAEKEQNHRINSDEKIIKGQIKQFSIGQILGFILCILALLLSGFFAFLKMAVLAGSTLTVTIVSLAVIFVLRQKPDTKSQS